MGLMRWLRGGDGDNTATAMISAGLAEIDGLFRPSKHKQTEHVEEQKRRRVDVTNAGGIDFERGIAVIRTPARGNGGPADAGAQPSDVTTQPSDVAAQPSDVAAQPSEAPDQRG